MKTQSKTSQKVKKTITKAVQSSTVPTPAKQAAERVQTVSVEQVPLVDIRPNPVNPRRYFDADSLAELVQNIIEHGVLQPVTVREKSGNDGKKYEIVFGERRYRAAMLAGLETVPCMIRNLDDTTVMEFCISENLSRVDIRPSEEAAAFQALMERGYGIAGISERFGKNEKFIHSRLLLNRLIPQVTELLDREEIGLGVAIEIARYEPDIQADVYKSHLEAEQGSNSWKNLSTKAFAEKMESKYTTLLGRFGFDKSECSACPCNSETRSLFPDISKSRCTRSACLVQKHEKHLVDTCLQVAKHEKIAIVAESSGVNSDVIRSLNELGVTVYQGVCHPYPEQPLIPDRNNFADEDDYLGAMNDYTCRMEEINGLEEQVASGKMRKVLNISNLEPKYGYVLVPEKQMSATGEQNKPDNSVGAVKPGEEADLATRLKQKDLRNRETAQVKLIDGAKGLLKEMEIQSAEFSQFEQNLLYFVMLADIHPSHLDIFGKKDQQPLTDDDKYCIIQNLTDQQKNIIRRDFILKGMLQCNGISRKSVLMLELARIHFPEELSAIENELNDEYERKQTAIEEKLKEIAGEKELEIA